MNLWTNNWLLSHHLLMHMQNLYMLNVVQCMQAIYINYINVYMYIVISYCQQ